jgi:sugar phosphate isomerase/epimerase
MGTDDLFCPFPADDPKPLPGLSLGSNTNNADVGTLAALGYSRIEVCLGRHKPYQEMLDKIFSDLDAAKAYGMKYTIHLPLHLFDWFPFDYLDGLYLDPNLENRNLAFEFLEENLKRLCQSYEPDYFILHFPGIYRNAYLGLDFEAILHESLGRLQSLALKYNTRLAVEYFGANASFNRAAHWVEALASYDRVLPLLDTGHLYFSCRMNGFDFEEVVETLGPHCIGFHVWTVRGPEYYGNSPFYRQYHHVIPHPEQTVEDGWAFDPVSVYKRLRQFGVPVVVEASGLYGGQTYFMEGLKFAAEHVLGGLTK